MSSHIDDYRRKRDLIVAGLAGHYELSAARRRVLRLSQSAAGNGAASSSPGPIDRRICLIIPGKVFSRRDTHFRISYAADDATLERGIEVLWRMAG